MQATRALKLMSSIWQLTTKMAIDFTYCLVQKISYRKGSTRESRLAEAPLGAPGGEWRRASLDAAVGSGRGQMAASQDCPLPSRNLRGATWHIWIVCILLSGVMSHCSPHTDGSEDVIVWEAGGARERSRQADVCSGIVLRLFPGDT